VQVFFGRGGLRRRFGFRGCRGRRRAVRFRRDGSDRRGRLSLRSRGDCGSSGGLRDLAAQAHANAFSLQLEIRETVLRNQLDQLAQLIHIQRRLGSAALLLLLRLLWLILRVTAASTTVAVAALIATLAALRLLRLVRLLIRFRLPLVV
jgi:hypothetical protein